MCMMYMNGISGDDSAKKYFNFVTKTFMYSRFTHIYNDIILESNTLTLNITLLICQLAGPATHEKHSNLCSL